MYLEMTVENGFSGCFVGQCYSVLPTAVKGTMANSSSGRKVYIGIHSFCAILNKILSLATFPLVARAFSLLCSSLNVHVFVYERVKTPKHRILLTVVDPLIFLL